MRNLFGILLLYSFCVQVFSQEGPDPCGPASILGEEFSKNVAKDSRCFELRFYTAEPAVNGKGGVDDLHQRFRERQIKLLEEHGADMVAHWQRLDNPNTVVWLLAFRNRAHRDEVFANFRADPEWVALREKYSVPVNRELIFMSATDYSNLK
tara:strand:- start:69 stop:524 length:456 start_codon:yes stop_codon:yes gene_type:complete